MKDDNSQSEKRRTTITSGGCRICKRGFQIVVQNFANNYAHFLSERRPHSHREIPCWHSHKSTAIIENGLIVDFQVHYILLSVWLLKYH